jgi:CHAD domain-containing protein
LPPEFRRLAVEELDTALEGLNAKSIQIHLARSRLKRVRALLLLAPPEDKTAAEQERVLRDAGRALSENRDMEVCQETLTKLERKPDPNHPLPATLFEQAREWVQCPNDSLALADAIAEALQKIGTARQVLSEWLPEVSWKTVRRALHHSYRRARRALEQACPAESNACFDPEAMHRLRKRLKTLWLQLRLVCECWPKSVEKVAGKAERLSNLLGQEHDLVILQERLSRVGSAPSLSPLIEKLAARRAQLDRRCIALAGRFLAEKPGAFAERIFGKE